MLVAIGIFIFFGGALVTMMYLGMEQWRKGERTRKTYEQAQAALGAIARDLETAYTREPVQQGVPTARFFCTLDGETRAQRLSFVRTFETGPERGFTFRAGSGSANATYIAGYTGDPAALRAIGGLIGVSYFLRGRELRRAVLGPPAAPSGGSLTSTTGGEPGVALIENALYIGFRFWTQTTTTWDEPPLPGKTTGGKRGTRTKRKTKKKSKPKVWRWPETVWDSTRGAGIEGLDARGRTRPFVFARGEESLAFPQDDVVPEIVEITLVIEPDEMRALKTDLTRSASESAMEIHVASTKGFRDPSTGPVYLLLGGSEWVECKSKGKRVFRIARRGVRGTVPGSYARGATVRCGTTFILRVHVPGCRADWSTYEDFRKRVRQ